MIISSDTLTPQDISNILTLKPSESFEKGAHAFAENTASAIHPTAVWLLENDLPDDAALDDHIEVLLEIVEDYADALTQVARYGLVEFSLGCFCRNERGNFTIRQDLLARLSALPVELTFDLYPSTPIPVVTVR